MILSKKQVKNLLEGINWEFCNYKQISLKEIKLILDKSLIDYDEN